MSYLRDCFSLLPIADAIQKQSKNLIGCSINFINNVNFTSASCKGQVGCWVSYKGLRLVKNCREVPNLYIYRDHFLFAIVHKTISYHNQANG